MVGIKVHKTIETFPTEIEGISYKTTEKVINLNHSKILKKSSPKNHKSLKLQIKNIFK